MTRAMMLKKTQPPTVPPTIAPMLEELLDPESEVALVVTAAGAVTVMIFVPSAVVLPPKDRWTVIVAPDAAQLCCVMVVLGYMTRNSWHSPIPEFVHFAMAEFVEQAESVHSVDMAVLGIHVVGSTQAERLEGSQQPCTPKKVFVAQTALLAKHVMEDAV